MTKTKEGKGCDVDRSEAELRKSHCHGSFLAILTIPVFGWLHRTRGGGYMDACALE